jgi:hypothetical protein
MASTIVCTVTSGAFNRTETSTLSDADAGRMLAALKAYFATDNIPSPTNNQAVDAWWADVMAKTKNTVQIQEKKTAQAASVDSIAPLTVT